MDLLEKADVILGIKDYISRYDEMMKVNERDFLRKQQTRKEEYERRERAEKLQYDEIKEELLRGRQEELEPYTDILNDCFYISVGDLKKELLDNLWVDEDFFEVRVFPLATIPGRSSIEERRKKIQSIENYQGLVYTYIRVGVSNVGFHFTYKMNYNMPQQDGRTFISYCDAKNERDWLDDTGEIMSSLVVHPVDYDNCMIKIPLKSLIEASGSLPKRKKSSSQEYYNITPHSVYLSCITSWLKKQKEENKVYQKKEDE